MFRDVTQDHSVFQLNDQGNLFDVTPGLPTNGFEAMSGLFFYMPGNIQAEGSDPCVCYIDPNTSRLMLNCDGRTRVCLNQFGTILLCDAPDANSTELFWYALSIDGDPITISPSSTTTTAPTTASITASTTAITTAITTNPITTSTSTSATGFATPQPTFAVRDAAQQNELSLISFPELADYAGYPQFGPIADRAADAGVPLFTLNGDGNLIYVTPGDTDGYYAYGNTGYPFIFEAYDSSDVTEFGYDLCVCTLATADSRLSCDCDGIITNCIGSCDAWYAFPV